VNRDSVFVESTQYQPQYDANNDFAIFGCGDVRTGGMQDMKEKMNMADQKNDSESSEEEDMTKPSSAPVASNVHT